ncbi:uncharacterized protein LOC127712806 [Mytilus californianus]|uniref:uncharacterized protein LOC127712806 n=1 Tax=Mytilus californianus TaxID=6549 RepID=UPI0022457E76|nr:uncharacterized protein LOC127712806 [Mytilus californianus]
MDYLLHDKLNIGTFIAFIRVRLLALFCETYIEKITGLLNVIVDITSAENTVTTIVATGLPTEAIIIEETTIKSCGPPTKDWLLYTLGTAGFIILTVLSHLLRSYSKRKSRLKNEEEVLESTTTSPYTGVYHEIDENVLTDVTLGVCLTSQSSNNEAVYFVPQERTSITTITEHIDTDYLDPVFAAEDEGDKSNDQMCKKESISTCSSDSDAIVSTSNENINPSKFKENRHEHLHRYNVPVTVHPCIESSSGTDEDATDDKYSHVYQSLQKDSQIKNNDYEKLRTTESMIHVIVNDATLQPVTQSIHGTKEFPHCINKHAGSDKTINSCDGMRIRDENIFDNNNLTTGDKKTVDAVECKESQDN